MRVGESVQTAAKGIAAKVTKISKISRLGFYAPLTQDGTIVVNDILASTYVGMDGDKDGAEIGGVCLVSYHTISHWWISPNRLICNSIASMDVCKNEVYDSRGHSFWARVSEELGMLFSSASVILQVVLAATIIPFAFLAFLIEVLFGNRLIVLAAAAVYAARRYVQIGSKHSNKVKVV